MIFILTSIAEHKITVQYEVRYYGRVVHDLQTESVIVNSHKFHVFNYDLHKKNEIYRQWL